MATTEIAGEAEPIAMRAPMAPLAARRQFADEFAGERRSNCQTLSTEDAMQTVTSADGTKIAYDRYGDGPGLILVNGAMSYRKFKKFEQLATALSDRFTVINYDRRGRGDSGPAGPVSVQHEVDDIAALIRAIGGRASLWGWSSGAALALRAAAADIGVEKIVAYETPFKTDPHAKFPADDYGARLEQILATGDRMAAAKHFMRNVGVPAPLVPVLALTPPFRRFARNAHTLMFDHAALGDHNMHGQPLNVHEWAAVTCPVLVAYGAKTTAGLKHASRALADVLPNATLRELSGQNHNVSAKAIVPLLGEFLGPDTREGARGTAASPRDHHSRIGESP